MDGASAVVDNSDLIVAAVREIDIEVGLVSSGVGVELAEVVLNVDLVNGGVGVVAEVEGEVASLSCWHGFSDGFAGVAGGADVVFHLGVGARELAGGGNSGDIVVVVIGSHVDFLPLSVGDTVHEFSTLDAVDIGDDGGNSSIVGVIGVAGVAMERLMEDADGVLGGNLLGDAVDGTAGAIEFTYVNTIDGVSWIGFLEFLDVGTVPGSGRHTVTSHGREAGLDDEVVDEGVVGVGACVLVVVLSLAGKVGTIVSRGEGDGGVAVGGIEDAMIGAEGVHVLVSCFIVGPAAVGVRHFAEDEHVFVNHVGVEVHMAGAAVIFECREDMGGASANEGAHAVEDLVSIEGAFAGIVDGVGVRSIPGELAAGVAVGSVDLVA